MLTKLKGNLFYAEEDGGSAGSAGIDDLIPPAENPTPADPTPGSDDPAWFSQLPKEMRENADNKAALGSYKNISDLATAYMQGKKDLEGTIRIPNKESKPEDVQKFFVQLGMPEKAEDYELENFDMKDEEISSTKDLFRKIAHQSALTKAQAKNLWMNEVAMAKAMRNVQAKNQKDLEDGFEPAYNKILEAEYPVEAERSKAVKGELDLVSKFFTETGLGKVMKDNNFIYNAEAMHSLAGYIKKHTGSFIDGKSGDPESKSIGVMGNYSEEFLKAAGK